MDARKKTEIECPFCEGYFLYYFKEIWLDDHYECFLQCGNCGFELVGRKDYNRKEIKLGNSDRVKYDKLFNKFKVLKGGIQNG